MSFLAWQITQIPAHENDDWLYHHVNQLPDFFQETILQKKIWQDRAASTLGYLNALQLFAVQNLRFNQTHFTKNEYKRPMLCTDEDFNISHSNPYVVSAIQSSGNVGIDIELIKPIEVEPFKRIFHPKEWIYLMEHQGKPGVFFELWTRKEALIKAIGKGMYLPLQDINCLPASVFFMDTTWYIHPISCGDHLKAHIATNNSSVIPVRAKHQLN